ncbi:efflux RND transporter permease subunit [Candidatus Palauibacter sp.]|uniref:efflux RND transporter permease subunit n=1 Tax=Candidatus Palauibacter sp. TaxID=3101350 RepID=UPI003B02E678
MRRSARRGPIAYMAKNGTAVNVVMLVLLVGGLHAAFGLVQEVIPDVSLDRVQVLVPYPGASPEEVEELIVRRIEEQIRGVEGLERVTAIASEGLASVIAEFKAGTDIDRVLNEMKAEVDRIPTFPADAERPEVREITSRQRFMRLLVHGDVPERTLKELAYGIEEGISALAQVSLASTSGTRPYEISVEIPQRRLRSLGLTLEDVARAVRQGSLELSAGKVSAGGDEILVRTLGRKYVQADFEDIIVLTRLDGTAVRVGDIATVRDGFADTELRVRYNGRPAARVDVYRTSDEQLLGISAAVQDYLATDVLPGLPAGVDVAIWSDDSDLVGGRLGLMVKNGLLGLVLVFIALALFLEIRLALWVAVGLAVSFTGAFLVMDFLGLSINMFSLMGLILALGIVVDDAIVVGESVYSEREKGAGGLAAAIRGTKSVSGPVIFSVLTTIVAFSTLMTVPGPQGKLARAIPIVVISVLVVSLLESLLILPNHLSHLPAPGRSRHRAAELLRRIRERVDIFVKRFVEGPLDRGLRLATGQPFVVLASAAGLLVLSSALVLSGIVPSRFIIPLEGDIVSASLRLPTGTPGEQTGDVADRVAAAGHRAVARVAAERGTAAGDLPLEVAVAVTVGQPAELFDPLAGDAFQSARGHLATVQFKLIDWERHGISGSTLERAWREEVGEVPEATALSITSSIVGGDLPVHYDLSYPDPVRLRAIADDVAAELAGIDGVFDVRTNLDEGFGELQLELDPAARTLHLTVDEFARQVRSAFFGLEALRVPRGREDVRVYVRLPEEERNSAVDIERYMVRTPGGGEVELGQISSARFARSTSAIHRLDGRRFVTVTADVDAVNATGRQVDDRLERGFFASLEARDPGFHYVFGGQRRQQDNVNAALARSGFLALIIMYALMAIPFGSWLQPLIVLAAIPLGAIGALAGHMLLGLDLSIWSQQGLIGVGGVVINDSLVMVKFMNDFRDSGMEPREAIIAGSKVRFRAILLTSVTTFLGVAPLVFETSTHARHLVPLATSVGFGVLVATFLLLLVVPALAAVQHHAGERLRRALARRWRRSRR